MNTAAVLALIGDLYAQITALQQRIAELEKRDSEDNPSQGLG